MDFSDNEIDLYTALDHQLDQLELDLKQAPSQTRTLDKYSHTLAALLFSYMKSLGINASQRQLLNEQDKIRSYISSCQSKRLDLKADSASLPRRISPVIYDETSKIGIKRKKIVSKLNGSKTRSGGKKTSKKRRTDSHT